MDDLQPIKYFPRLDIRLLQYLSEIHLTHAEVNVLLEIIALSDFNNVAEGIESLSRHMQDRFEVSKRVMNRYLQHIKELDIVRPVCDNPKAFRGLPFLYNRLQFLNSLWEYSDVNTNTGWVLGNEFSNWQISGDGSKTLHSPSYARLTKRQNKSEKRISQSEHDRIVAALRLEHTEERRMLRHAFMEELEETRREARQLRELAKQEAKAELKSLVNEFKDTLTIAIAELRKYDPNAAEKIQQRHLRLVKNDE